MEAFRARLPDIETYAYRAGRAEPIAAGGPSLPSARVAGCRPVARRPTAAVPLPLRPEAAGAPVADAICQAVAYALTGPVLADIACVKVGRLGLLRSRTVVLLRVGLGAPVIPVRGPVAAAELARAVVRRPVVVLRSGPAPVSPRTRVEVGRAVDRHDDAVAEEVGAPRVAGAILVARLARALAAAVGANALGPTVPAHAAGRFLGRNTADEIAFNRLSLG